MTSVRLITVVACLAVVTSIAFATPYDKSLVAYRNSLLHNGWKPFDFGQKNPDVFPVTGGEVELIKAGVNEVDSCSMDAGVLCNLWYVKDGQCIRVVSKGERLKNMMVVFQRLEECPIE